MNTLLRSALAATFALIAMPALAEPVLRADITVSSAIVTVGDMFTDAGALSETALFRAPALGTTGMVTLPEVRSAALRIGMTAFDDAGLEQVRVARSATVVDEALLTDLINRDLDLRGILSPGVTAQTRFSVPLEAISAEDTAGAVRLQTLRYMPGTGAFSARFILAGQVAPLDVSGDIDLMVEAPHLVASLPGGTVLSSSDIELRKVPLRVAEANGYAPLEALVGKALQRQSRAGMMLRPSDVAEPLLISRNEAVTVVFRKGPMTLTVKGQSLSAAAKGQTVQVLNLTSKRVLTGVAISPGTVEVTAYTTNVAGL